MNDLHAEAEGSFYLVDTHALLLRSPILRFVVDVLQNVVDRRGLCVIIRALSEVPGREDVCCRLSNVDTTSDQVCYNERVIMSNERRPVSGCAEKVV